MLSHLLCQNAQPDTRHVIDSKPRIFRIIKRKQPPAAPPNFIILEPLRDPLQAHALHHLSQHHLDEDTTT